LNKDDGILTIFNTNYVWSLNNEIHYDEKTYKEYTDYISIWNFEEEQPPSTPNVGCSFDGKIPYTFIIVSTSTTSVTVQPTVKIGYVFNENTDLSGNNLFSGSDSMEDYKLNPYYYGFTYPDTINEDGTTTPGTVVPPNDKLCPKI